jgi:SAM-dependent methyltransferase
MGLSRAAVALIVREAARQPFSGSVCTLGRQHVYVTPAELQGMARQHGLTLAAATPELHREPDLAARGFMSDDYLFASLGFSRTTRLDYSEYEAPDVILDLNQRETPDHLQRQFDLVLDSGTLEHVFDVPAVLGHCVRMVKAGGRIIHLTPSSNCVDHGLYSVSPALYADFYPACGCQVEQILLCRLPLRLTRGWWRIYEYPLDKRVNLPIGQLDGLVWFTWAVISAGEDPKPAAVQQSSYVRTWTEHKQNEPVTGLEWYDREPANSRAGRLLKRVSGSPTLTRLARMGIASRRWLLTLYHEYFRGPMPFRFLGRV